MDGTLNQILNDLLLTQAENRQLRVELEAIRAEHANCPRPEPKVEPVASSNGKAPVDARVVAEQSA